ncbi:hypothetical protein PRUPE_1G446500 [Prunus persica]|uniref:Uncharacterized protein n=1 Tax=Prunus persica TaxID=3760 RepID=M5XN90_PRUPE|nr:hypothetical protein PRUPE_1G446500 [Prunus persica]
MTMTANCDICGAPMENAAHIVRNCPATISVWHQSLMPMNMSLLQAVDLHTWVAKNLHNSTILTYGVEWSTIKGEDGRIAAGGVLRDSYGQWMRGFAVNLGVGQVLEAKLWGIYLGLKITWDIGCSAVVLEYDSATAVHLLNKNVEDFHPLATMLWGCQAYINKNWVCSIHHVYRECNMVANKLAELSSCLGLGLSTFHDPHDSIRSFLSEDLLGVCRPRAIV